MTLHVWIEDSIMPEWIEGRGPSDLSVWFVRADIRSNIKSVEELQAPSPWRARYRTVNFSGEAREL